MRYFYCSYGILTFQCISGTFLLEAETINTPGVPFLSVFGLTKRQSYTFLRLLTSRNINRTFLHALKPLSNLCAPHLAHLSL